MQTTANWSYRRFVIATIFLAIKQRWLVARGGNKINKNSIAGMMSDDDLWNLETEFPWLLSRKSLKSRPGPKGFLKCFCHILILYSFSRYCQCNREKQS